MRSAFFAVASLFAIAAPADAALFVSGDSNIFGSGGTFTFAANQQFLRNIAGGNVLIQDTSQAFLDAQAEAVAAFLTMDGITNTLLSEAAEVTAADLSGRGLFIGLAPLGDYTAGEIAAMAGFLSVGGNILFTGDNAFIAATNDRINTTLTALGSGMQIITATIDAGFNPASILSVEPFTAGTEGFQYAATSAVTGGRALYGTLDRTPFLSVDLDDRIPAIPEPATWAMFIVGFGAVGFAARRRRPVTATA